MGPKSKSRDRDGYKSSKDQNSSSKAAKDERLEQLQADHELFLQAFEKPTQIYRYLRTRNLISPIFLNRTLSFMNKRLSRSTSRRHDFKVDSLLERKVKETKELEPTSLARFMNLTFLGYYERKVEKPLDKVSVELLLVKLSHKKRKESTSPVVQVSLGTSEVPVNPSEDHPPGKAPALSIPSELFSLSNGHQIKSYSLVVRVHHNPQSTITTNGTTDETSLDEEGGKNVDENLEPAAKRRKLLLRGTSNEDDDQKSKLLTAELVVYDKLARCLLTEGEYELVLAEMENNSRISPKKNSTWENITIDKEKAVYQQFDVFGNSPTLKFRLSWSSESAGAMVERPRPLMPRDNSQQQQQQQQQHLQQQQQQEQNDGNKRESSRSKLSRSASTSGSVCSNGKQQQQQQLKQQEKTPRIVYQFLYNNNSRQQTEAREDLHCPWCSLNCLELYALLKHLKLSHPRFIFTYVPIQDGARIDVSVSELYDSTYVGNPHDMISQPPGYAFSRYGPVQRTSITNILVCKPKRTKHSLSEFLEIEDNDLNGPYDGQRPFVTGHNRLYHYSTTCLPQPPHAIIQPSTEDQVDPPWLNTKICRMLDEFSDVNEGEKEFMKIWNLHIQHYTYVGDCQMNLALKMFIEEKGRELLQKNLYRNFVLHVCNLFEFGVLGPGHVFAAITRIQQFIRDQNLSPNLDWKVQRESWIKTTSKQLQSSPIVQQPRKDFSGIFKSEKAAEVSSSNSTKLPIVTDASMNPIVVVTAITCSTNSVMLKPNDQIVAVQTEKEANTTTETTTPLPQTTALPTAVTNTTTTTTVVKTGEEQEVPPVEAPCNKSNGCNSSQPQIRAETKEDTS